MPSQTPDERPEKRHDTLWFSDGNIVLSAVESSTGDTIVFCIHKSSLARQSKVFESMFELPQGADTGDGVVEAYGGLNLPLVRVPDAAEDVEALLNALHDPLPLSQRSLLSDTPLRLRKALHMASKYLMDDLRAKLIRILEQEWPPNLNDLNQKDRILDDMVKSLNGGVFLVTEWPLHLTPEPAAAIALAEDYDIPSILPAAYYDLLRCAPGVDWDLKFAEEPPGGPTGFRFCVSHVGGKPARWESLSRDSLLKLLRLQGYVERHYHFEFKKTLLEDNPECNNTSCRKTWVDLVNTLGTVPTHVCGRDIYRVYRALVSELQDANSQICLDCLSAYAPKITKGRNAVWSKLEEICLAK
ncbi:hypothetical protein SCHPADRAFT_355310 [Schizopora paradoxa]|uniref:BTB domain-containing protein n=1 Tax=Schizopora paradoxa TaxID=27342 RepID=A0A0H2RP01_9AGAM|nr:hypothetical protein SCHPADRAFT_355310 [Schizopora paradoxa]